ncbi:hypothetical protein J6590_075280, partial [Homalodisca vitripennis]
MFDKCGKCDLEISQTKDGSKCPDCNIMFHLKCLNPGYAESGKKVTRKNAKCDGCLSDTSSTASQVRDDREFNLTSVMDAIAAFRKETQEQWSRVQSQLSTVQTDVKEVKAEVSLLKTQLDETTVKTDQMCLVINKLETENKELKVQLAALNLQMCDIQQHSRKNNILITGIPVTPREDCLAILDSMARALDIPFRIPDISVA